MWEEYIFRPWKGLLRDRAFIICSVFLILCGLVLQVSARWLRINFIKEPLPLQKLLADLDEQKLLPYKVLEKQEIKNPDIIDELGTEDYLTWKLEDPSRDASDPVRKMDLFITYYTGDPGQVPHVPEVCYVGSGNMITKREESSIRIREKQGKEVDIPLTILTIEEPGLSQNHELKVIYFFRANGSYENSRNGLRMRLNNLFNKYAFFSKVELAFGRGEDISLEEATQAAERLSEKLVPVLVEEHWPKWPPEE